MKLVPMANTLKLHRNEKLFALASLLAGLLHYTFQIRTASKLGTEGYANFATWFATCSIFLMLGSVAQYYSNYYPASPAFYKRLSWINLAFAILSLGTSASNQGYPLIASLTLSTLCFGFLSGQLQVRLAFLSLGVIGVITALTKVIALEVDSSHSAPYAAIAWCYVSGALLLILKLQKIDTPKNRSEKVFDTRAFLGSAIITLQAGLIPNIDLILASRITLATVFEEFAIAALICKGIYFFLSIGFQLILPRQVGAAQKAEPPKAWLFAGLALLALGPILGLAIAYSELLIQFFIAIPSRKNLDSLTLFFYAWHIVSMTTVLFVLPILVAQRRIFIAFLLILPAPLMALLPLWELLNFQVYLELCIMVEVTLVIAITLQQLIKYKVTTSDPSQPIS